MNSFATTAIISSPKFLPGLSAIALGLALILTIGFMQDTNNYVHNAAHDTRHSAGFPCH